MKYESLIGEFEVSLKKLIDWLCVEWEPNIFTRAQLTNVSSHPGVPKPINRNAFGHWRADLPIDARKLFRSSPSDTLIKLGYGTDNLWIDGL